MLWQKLQREMPATLAETIRIADSYALGDPMQPLLNSGEPSRRYPVNNRPGPVRQNDRQDFGNKRREPDYGYGSNQVAAVNQDQPDAGNSQRPKYNGPAWGQNQEGKRPWGDQKQSLTYEAMLDGPCSFHTQNIRRPANHTTRQCSWCRRMTPTKQG